MTGIIPYRVNIKFLVALGESRESVREKIQKVYQNEAPSISTIDRWFNFFKQGGQSTSDGVRSGRPLQPVNSRLLKQITKLIKDDPKISLSMIARFTGETKSYIQKVIDSSLEYQFVISRWVPIVLNKEEKVLSKKEKVLSKKEKVLSKKEKVISKAEKVLSKEEKVSRVKRCRS